MLHAKYESSGPYGLGQKDFKNFPLYLYVKSEIHNIGLISTPGP